MAGRGDKESDKLKCGSIPLQPLPSDPPHIPYACQGRQRFGETRVAVPHPLAHANIPGPLHCRSCAPTPFAPSGCHGFGPPAAAVPAVSSVRPPSDGVEHAGLELKMSTTPPGRAVLQGRHTKPQARTRAHTTHPPTFTHVHTPHTATDAKPTSTCTHAPTSRANAAPASDDWLTRHAHDPTAPPRLSLGKGREEGTNPIPSAIL